MITVHNLVFDYPGKRALDNVSFTIEPKTITALVGPNGAGKTTLLRCLAALETPLQGTIEIQGYDTSEFPRKIHEVSYYLSDFFGLYNELTVKQNLTYSAWARNCPSNQVAFLVDQAAKRLEIESYLTTKAAALSRGLRQRVAIAQSILHEPKILLLDEPASGLDPQSRAHLSLLLKELQSKGMTIIVSSHILSELEDYCTQMLVLKDGKLIEQNTLTPAINLIAYILTLSENAEKYQSQLAAIPGIQVKSINDKKVTIDLNIDILAQNVLLKTLINNNIPVNTIQIEKQSLQSIYLSVTQNSDKGK